jgi:GNAT superfamily N-acetyltransferase
MSLEVRRIRADEGLRLRALRLHALADTPTAFSSTLSREEVFPEGVWHERAAGGAEGCDRVTLIAEQDGRWLGLATGLAEDPDGPKQSGPVLVGMFVDGAERRHGVGAMLVEGVAAWARARGAARLSLWVFSSNEPAIALYRKCGFRPTGETKPLAHSPILVELRMVRDLT